MHPSLAQEQQQIFPQSSQPLQDQINQQGIDYITQSKNIRVTMEEPQNSPRVDASDEGEKEDSAMQQAAERGGKGGQDEEEEDVIGAMEETEMQRQQGHKKRSELEREDAELDESALEEYSHNRRGREWPSRFQGRGL